MRLPLASGHGFSNWLVLGVGAQHQEDADSSELDKSFGLVTFRAFLGKAFGWRKSADVGSTQAMIRDRVLEQAPTYVSALALAEQIERATEGRLRTKVQQFVLDAVGEAEPDPGMSAEDKDRNWRRVLDEMARGEADAITDQPTLSAYAEWSGWYSFEDDPDADRYKDLFTATLDYWPFESYDNALLRLRYEHGYERAAPQIKKNQVMVSVVLRF